MSETRSVTAMWGDETQTCINWSFQGKWTGSDYFESLVQVWKLMDSKQENLNLLVDMQHSRANPSNLVALMQAAVRKQPSCNIRRIVVVTNTSYWQSLYEIASRHNSVIAGLDVHFVATPNEANKLLNAFD